MEEMSRKNGAAVTAWILAGIPVISVIGSIMHFVYEWSGGLAFIGVIAPVNESVWEHLKLLFWPVLIWWTAGYLSMKKKADLSASQWFCSVTTGLYAGPLFIAAFYYFYTEAFGIHSLCLDILSFILGVAVAQLLSLHVYRYAKTSKPAPVCAGIAIILFGAAFIIFTFYPPEIPLFLDPSL